MSKFSTSGQEKALPSAGFFVNLKCNASLAQLDRVFGFEPNGWGFDSLTTHQTTSQSNLSNRW